ncbi:MAG: dipeptide/oligopeptide/nickel ABC transporter ATP-binding protein [Lachnospiraceae bacterium]|nr:dipeptide/oligopeptide/nickel ABC transporter ATP-binding protein [Lachnospiraceae bacterium]
MAEADAILEGKNLKKTFVSGSSRRKKITKAVDGVSLELRPGDSVALIGSSGCGKTTTVKLLLGLTKPEGGELIKKGRIGFVGQNPYETLSPVWTVGRIVAEPLLFSGICRGYEQCREEIRRVLSLVHLDFDIYEKRLPSQLSGGERQRVSIARALILQPDFLVLDEPTSMLDEEVKGKILDVIREIMEKGAYGVLLVTHDIAAARTLCSRLLVMEAGKILEEGPAEDIFAAPKAELTKKLIAVATDLKGFWRDYRE